MQDSVKMSKPELILCCYFAVFISYFVNFSLQIPRKLYFTIFSDFSFKNPSWIHSMSLSVWNNQKLFKQPGDTQIEDLQIYS